MKNEVIAMQREVINAINHCGMDERIDLINQIKLMLHEISPFKTEPVDCVLWVKNETVFANVSTDKISAW